MSSLALIVISALLLISLPVWIVLLILFFRSKRDEPGND